MFTENPWTTDAIVNDYHLGSRSEARMIAAENGHEPAVECGHCGRVNAFYRHTAGTVQCFSCRSLLLVRDEGGAAVYRWSTPR